MGMIFFWTFFRCSRYSFLFRFPSKTTTGAGRGKVEFL